MKYTAEMILVAAAIVFVSEAARARHNDLFVEGIWKQIATAEQSLGSVGKPTRLAEPAVQ